MSDVFGSGLRIIRYQEMGGNHLYSVLASQEVWEWKLVLWGEGEEEEEECSGTCD